MKAWLTFLQELADDADVISLEYFNSLNFCVEAKADASPVTEADKKIERVIRQKIQKRYPELSVLGEEEGLSNKQSEMRLIIDPIDATRNFMRGIPIYATLLAIQQQGVIIAGVVSAPALGSRWWASLGEGAYHNGKLIHVSSIDNITESYGFHSDYVNLDTREIEQQIYKLLRDSIYTRGIGDFYQHMLVAMGCGEYALNIGYKKGIEVWDTAAVKIIVEEAGGKCTNLENDDTALAGHIISTNGVLHNQVLKYFQE